MIRFTSYLESYGLFNQMDDESIMFCSLLRCMNNDNSASSASTSLPSSNFSKSSVLLYQHTSILVGSC
jgi:hypothetical protein